ncbi:hypothetical protein [Frankia gtarii]|uniref:hypothetical protein n=1 Tax=Frankia gtarii TaxID=2950102 RepID=UPI0021BFD8BF|nr:hypothetical protein [Frankia gtarii]
MSRLVQGIERVAVRDLRAAVLWAQVRTAHAGVFSASQVEVPVAMAEDVGRWLDVLAAIRLLSRYQTVSGMWMYTCRSPLAVAAPDGGRPLDTISPREWWAAVVTAQLPTGKASAAQIAAFLDTRTGRVDRIDLLLRLAALAAGGRLRACTDRSTAPSPTDIGWMAITTTPPPP